MVLSDDPVLDERRLPTRIRGGFGAAGAGPSGESLRGAAQEGRFCLTVKGELY